MKLCADKTLGKLIKWLRILGIPCAQRDFKKPQEVPGDLIFLTRKQAFRALPQAVFIPYDQVEDQLHFLFRRLPHLKDQIAPLRLCLKCNEPLKELPKEKAFGLVPEYVYETQDHFRACPRCGRIYWKGTHPQRMLRCLKEWGLTVEMGG